MKTDDAKPNSLVATFRDAHAARAAADRLREAGFGADVMDVGSRTDAKKVGAAEQKEERDELLHSPGPVPVATEQMAKGGGIGIVTGALLFGVLGLVIWSALVMTGVLGNGFTIVIGTLAAALFGAVAGAVIGAGSKAKEHKEEELQSAGEVPVGVTAPSKDRLTEAKAILRQVGAERIDHFDASR